MGQTFAKGKHAVDAGSGALVDEGTRLQAFDSSLPTIAKNA